MCVIKSCAIRRCVPLRPDVVRHLLNKEKKFTTDADKGVVADLYERFFKDVTCDCTELVFVDLGWQDQEIRELALSMRCFEKLEYLFLTQNETSDEGAVAAADALKHLNHLKRVDLEDNNIGLVGEAALREVVKADTELVLRGNPCEGAQAQEAPEGLDALGLVGEAPLRDLVKADTELVLRCNPCEGAQAQEAPEGLEAQAGRRGGGACEVALALRRSRRSREDRPGAGGAGADGAGTARRFCSRTIAELRLQCVVA